MNENQINHNAHDVPPVALSLAVNCSLHRVPDEADPLHEAVRKEIAQSADEILQMMGIPGTTTVEITTLDSPRNDEILRLSVNGRLCRHSDELYQRVQSYVKGIPLSPAIASDSLLTWLIELSGGDAKIEEANSRSLIQFLSLTCMEIIKREPAVMLGSAQANAYRASLVEVKCEMEQLPEMWPPDSEWLHSVLGEALNLKISIADTQAVTKVLKESLAKGRSCEDAVEDLIAALSTDVIEIYLSPDYLRQITTTSLESAHDQFTMMRDGMFYETGVRYPRFQFAPAANLKPNSFAFKINHLTTLPQIGLRLDQVLVNDTPERLGLLSIDGKLATNPANGYECSIIEPSSLPLVEAAQLTTWGQLGYLVLCLSASLRENGACFINRQTVQNMLSQLEEVFPALIAFAKTGYTVEQITRVLKALIKEEISIRNLRAILECLVNYDFIVADTAKYIVLDDRLPVQEPPAEVQINDTSMLTSFTRSRMKRYISHKYMRGQGVLKVYLLDPKIETMLSKRSTTQTDGTGEMRLAEEEEDRFLQAIRSQYSAPSTDSSPPIILTLIEIRQAVRDIIAAEFPRLAVLDYQELSPDINIQTITRIT